MLMYKAWDRESALLDHDKPCRLFDAVRFFVQTGKQTKLDAWFAPPGGLLRWQHASVRNPNWHQSVGPGHPVLDEVQQLADEVEAVLADRQLLVKDWHYDLASRFIVHFRELAIAEAEHSPLGVYQQIMRQIRKDLDESRALVAKAKKSRADWQAQQQRDQAQEQLP